MKKNHKLARFLRRYARLTAVEALSRLALATQRNVDAPSVHVLLMHDVRKKDHDRFRRLLRRLSNDYELVAYRQAVAMIRSGKVEKPTLSFSFDDGYRSCWDAAEILEQFGVTAMFFVCPSIIESSISEQAHVCRERMLREPTPFLTWSEIESLKNRGHEFGSHTLTHPRVDTLRSGQLHDELGASKIRIAKKLGSCEHFAWPYGRFAHFSAAAYLASLDVGYQTIASGERGSHAAHDGIVPRLPCIRRESIDVSWPQRHVNYFLNQSRRDPVKPCDCVPSEWKSEANTRTTLRRTA